MILQYSFRTGRVFQVSEVIVSPEIVTSQVAVSYYNIDSPTITSAIETSYAFDITNRFPSIVKGETHLG